MSVYAELLEKALDLAPRPEAEPTSGDRLAELLRHRRRLQLEVEIRSDCGSAPDRIASQLSHDVALIEMARSLGIRCDTREFDQVQVARTRLEDALLDRGILLGVLDDRKMATR